MNNFKFSIAVLALLIAGISTAGAVPGQTSACDSCHTLSQSIIVTTNATSTLTVNPGQSFAVGITYSGGLSAGKTEVNWPNVLNNTFFNPTLRVPVPADAATNGTTSSVLIAPASPGLYNVRVYASSGSGAGPDGTNFSDISVTVQQPSMNIISLLPSTTTVNNQAGEKRTFMVTDDQPANVTWLINGSQVQSNNSLITSSYINDSAEMGSWNVTAVVMNDNGKDTSKWDWIVKAPPVVGVEIKDLAFNPAQINISKGTAVIWTNNDSLAHTVTSDTNLFDSGNVNPGQTFEFTFNEIGTFKYHCSIHPEMLGEITVIPAPTPIQPPVEEIGIDLELVAENFTAPIALVSPDDGTGRRFIADQIGVIRILTQDGQVLSEPFLNLSSKIVNLRPQYDERGLLGLAFHPNFKQNGLFYVYYTAPLRPGAPANWDSTSIISEFSVLQDNPNKTNESSERILLQVDKPQSNHNAGQIAFGPDEYLYIPIGDGGNANDEGIGHPKPGNAQNISTLLGKILRIDVDNGTPYGIPPDNPFVGKDGLDEIFAYGLRNPFRLAFDAGGNNSLFVSDAGQNAWEEVNIITNGGNYGWNIREGAHCFDPNNPNLAQESCPDVSASGQPLIDPVIEYANAGQSGGLGVVVVGGFVYRGNLLPRFNGDYLFGDFSKGFTEGNGSLFVARPPPTGQKMWSIKELKIASSASGRIGAFVHSFGQDSDNEIYVLTSDMLGPSNNTGKVFKIKPVAISRIFTANLSGDEEVPPIDTPARGNATFELNDNGTMLHYRLMVENITNVTMAHIHMAPFGQNGSVVAWLYPNVPPAVLIPGRFDGLLAEGNITSANLTGPLAGKSFDILMESIMNETAYVNVHTDRYPAGEIRGQIKPAEAAPSVAPEITNFTPEESNVTDMAGGPTRTFTINVNQIVNVSWHINGEEVSSQTSVNTSSYSNASAAPGIWNVTAIASNSNGSDTHMWVWTVTEQIIGNSSISGMKFNDSNGNGIKEAGESPLSNWTIVLKNSAGSIENTIMTDVNGSYTFSNLTPGNYIVAEVIKPDWKQTLPANGTYNVTVTGAENQTGLDFGNNLPVTPPANVTKAVRIIEKESLRPGESTNITVDISSNMSQALALHEIIPAGWNLTRISDDADAFKNSTSESIWFNVSPGINKTVIYRLTAPDNASIGTYHINGTISSASGVIATVGGNNIITLDMLDIIAFYRRLGSETDRVETTDVLTAADDWRTGTAPTGFARPITSSELSDLIKEWAGEATALKITSFTPSETIVNDTVDAKRTFKVTMNQIANVKWFINGTEVFNESGVTTSSYANTSSPKGIWNITAAASNSKGSDMHTWVWTVISAAPPGDQTAENAEKMLMQGKQTFRYDTFGDEAFWGDTLKIHEAIAGAANGGTGPGVSPKTALAVGLKVDVSALPLSLIEDIKNGSVDLDDPATTLALLKLNAVVGINGSFDSEGNLSSIGITCAVCHSTVDDSFSSGIGNRLDGWANPDLNVGAIVNLSPDLSPVAQLLNVSEPTVRTVLKSWGPGKFDAELFLDGKAFNPQQVTDGIVTGQNVSGATLIPNAYGLAGFNQNTWTGSWGTVTYWNAFVANIEMHGKGTFFDPRLDNASKFPIAAANKFGHLRTNPDDDLITSKLPALQFYQLALPSPVPQPGIDFDKEAALRGDELFSKKAQCNNCHTEPIWTEPGWNLHKPSEIGIDDFQAERAPDGLYKTMNLGGIFVRESGKFMNPENKGRFYHDGRFKTLMEVVNHYDKLLTLGLSDQEKSDLVEYLKSLSSP